MMDITEQEINDYMKQLEKNTKENAPIIDTVEDLLEYIKQFPMPTEEEIKTFEANYMFPELDKDMKEATELDTLQVQQFFRNYNQLSFIHAEEVSKLNDTLCAHKLAEVEMERIRVSKRISHIKQVISVLFMHLAFAPFIYHDLSNENYLQTVGFICTNCVWDAYAVTRFKNRENKNENLLNAVEYLKWNSIFLGITGCYPDASLGDNMTKAVLMATIGWLIYIDVKISAIEKVETGKSKTLTK